MNEKAPRTLHDRIFKEFLHRFLAEFLQIFFPEEAARLELPTLTFLDQELLVNLPDQTLRITDIVAEVQALDGEQEAILVHVEVEGRDKATLDARMFEYYALLRLLRRRRVLPLALVIMPNAGGLSWPVYRESLFGRELLAFQYGQVALRDLFGSDYLGDNPVAATLAALMKPGALHPAELKLATLRTVIDSGLTDGDKLFLINVIETYLPQEGLSNAGDEIMQALVDTELSWAERIELRGKLEGERKGKLEGERKGKLEGERKGKREGELLGRLQLIMRQLQVRFGELPADFERRLRAVDDPAVLDEIGVQALTAVTLDDIELPV